MSRVAAFVTHRYWKFAIVVFWVVLAGIFGGIGSKLADATSDETASFLPEDADSTKVQALLKDRFPGGETSIGLIVYRRQGGLTEADQQRIADDAAKVDKTIPVSQPSVV